MAVDPTAGQLVVVVVVVVDLVGCDQVFSQSLNLKIHMRVHTGDRPYMSRVAGRLVSLEV